MKGLHSEVTMKIKGILAVIALAAAPLATVSAQNAVLRELAPATYTFSCDSASPLTLTPVSFSFGIQNTTDIGSQSSGAGAGKVTFNTLTVKFRTNKTVVQLLQDVETGKHYSACTLTETIRSQGRRLGAATVFTWDFHLVFPSSVTMIGSDGSNTNSGGTDVPTGYVEAGFEYGAVQASVSE
jgi:hypothetical protein